MQVLMRRLSITIVLLSLLMGTNSLWAKFPEKPITILVHSKPGSAIDITSRQISNIARKYCPVPILVENKSGGLVSGFKLGIFIQPTVIYPAGIAPGTEEFQCFSCTAIAHR